jgi:peptide/nickel transport system permease protein
VIRFILRRLVAMVGVLFAVSVLTFLIFNVIPNSDPAVRMAGKDPKPGEVAAIRHTWGFDKPLPDQYVITMKKVFTGDLVSYTDRENVTQQIGEGLPRTLFLAIGAGIVMLLGGVALGTLSALKSGSWLDRLTGAGAVVGMSMPVFWIGALVSYYLGSQLGIIPPGGYETIAQGGVLGWLWHLIAPCIVLAILFVGVYSRVLRSDLLGAMGADYVRTARSKGIPEKQVVVRHGLRTALIPVITLWGLDVGLLLGGGAVLTEKVFDLGGVGQYFADSVDSLDVPPVLAITMFAAVMIVVLNAAVDILYAALDPRIRR